MSMYVVVKTTQNDEGGPDWEDVLFGGEDPKVLNAAADLLSGARSSDFVSYDVVSLAVLERKNLLALGEFLKAHNISFE